MLRTLILLIVALAVAAQQDDPAARQLADFKERTTGPIGIMTTAAGAPVEYKEATSSLNTDLLSNEHLIDEMTSLVRERIPERVVHAVGTGAFGYFETTHNISHICSAKLFSEVGKRTPIAVRFSTGVSSLGGSDTGKETRGFAVKFYTEEGNFDLPGLNVPVFTFRDPLLFNPITHGLKRNPASNLPDSNMVWDYMTLNPQSLFAFLYVLSDFGMPVGFKHMSGFPLHTYQVHNADGVNSYVRFHFLPVAGIKVFNLTEARQIAASDPNYYTRDLYNSIENGEFPSWYLKVQIISEEERETCGIDIFDATRYLPVDLFPLHDVGILTLNRNPVSHFAQIEQLAFCPGNVVPGIPGSPDKLFAARRLAYRDAQNYRLTANFKKIPVNCPMQAKVLTYNRDGVFADVENDGPNYYRNSFNGPIPYVDKKRQSLIKIYEKESNNFDQLRKFYADELCPEQQSSLVTNILELLCSCEEIIKNRAVKLFTVIHSDLGNRVTEGLRNCTY